MTRFLYLILAVLIPIGSASSAKKVLDIKHPLTEEDINNAIERGEKSQKEAHLILKESLFGGYTLSIFTPTTRIIHLTQIKAAKYLEVSPEEFSDDAKSGVITVICYPHTQVNGFKKRPYAASHIVILSNEKKPEVIQPLSLNPLPVKYSNLRGASFHFNTLIAKFPISEVERLSQKSKSGSIYIEVIGGIRKKFKLTKKYWKKLP